jgi:phosphoribosylformylglycinamidine synthase
MGARPVALLDGLRFAEPGHAFSRAVGGIGAYGNSVGVPTVGGETVFDETYADNPLVNVLCLGLMPTERLVLGRAEGAGNLAVLLGSSTGRDGIGGVSVLASAGFSDEAADADKRPSVQVGDPFEEKRLIEASLELLDRDLAVGVQDLGGAGITCATSETAAKGGAGMDVLVGCVPRRQPGMEPFEVMTSESQERMLAIVTPEHLDEVLAIAARWEITATVIGTVTGSGRLRILDHDGGDVLADVPAKSLEEDAPLYDRPRAEPADLASRRADSADALPAPVDAGADVVDMLCDTSWVWSQYDHMLFLNTVEGPGGDAAVLRLKHPTSGADTGRGLALTTDGNHLWCSVDPRHGSAMVMAESVMNLAVVGARPVAMVNCMNFGNPEHPEVMWQFSESVDGLSDALRAFDVPCVGGNVSLYNESRGRDIDPTPIIGVLGVVESLDRPPPGVRLVDGGRIILVGETAPDLSGSLWASRRGHRGLGTLPELDLEAVAVVAGVVRELVGAGLVAGAHDVSQGGLGLALAEMAVASGVGFNVARVPDHRHLFSESAGRAVLCVAAEQVRATLDVLEAHGVRHARIGAAAGDRMVVKDLLDVALSEARSVWRDRLPRSIGAGTTQG